MAKKSKSIETIIHEEASRKYIPTAEFENVLNEEQQNPIHVAYQRRNPDLDPQLVWRGKDLLNWSDLIVQVPPLYIQEKIHPKVLIDDLRRQTEQRKESQQPQQIDMFADFNGIPSEAAKTEFYQHDANWSNRMILGDSLEVMASLAEREGLRGKVQMIYIDPPYGIKFNSNFQWSTTSREVQDGNIEHITREPEQVKAFRDTWRDGIHSYLNYLKERLIISRELLSESGVIFIQIGAENVHRIRIIMDETFGDENFISQISVRKTSTPSLFIDDNQYYILFYSKSRNNLKFRTLYNEKILYEWVTETKGGSWGVTINYQSRALTIQERKNPKIVPENGKVYALSGIKSAGKSKDINSLYFQGKKYFPGSKEHWKTAIEGLDRVNRAGRLESRGGPPWFKKYHQDSPIKRMTNVWDDTSGKTTERVFVVQTEPIVLQRLILMTTDPGDLVLDPTCGSGTTATVAEQWGRRWITIDTSRVALALARARLMGARYPYYLLKDSREGQLKEAEITRRLPSEEPTYHKVRQGFVYERVPHITLKSIANNTEIDVIWETYQEALEPLREALNQALGENWQEWEIPREAGLDWSSAAKDLHQQWQRQRIARQKEIDASIAAKADYEYLVDKPYEDKSKVRVAGPFTVESLLPHRVLSVDEDDEMNDQLAEGKAGYGEAQNFVQMILENLKTAGVQQARKADKINFSSLTPFPGYYVCAEGRYIEGDEKLGVEKRAGIFIGPEFGTVSRPDLAAAAREAGETGFDVLIACAFNYDARTTEFDKMGRIPILKARMNADLHMADDLKNTGKGNLFVIFGEPDISILEAEEDQIKVKVNGVDIFDPGTGEVRSDNTDGIACWFVDTDYNEESFFVRQAYFLGANDPYQSLKTSLKAEINEEAWETLHSDTSRAFEKPASGRIAVKVINHLGDEVMKVFRVN